MIKTIRYFNIAARQLGEKTVSDIIYTTRRVNSL